MDIINFHQLLDVNVPVKWSSVFFHNVKKTRRLFYSDLLKVKLLRQVFLVWEYIIICIIIIVIIIIVIDIIKTRKPRLLLKTEAAEERNLITQSIEGALGIHLLCLLKYYFVSIENNLKNILSAALFLTCVAYNGMAKLVCHVASFSGWKWSV